MGVLFSFVDEGITELKERFLDEHGSFENAGFSEQNEFRAQLDTLLEIAGFQLRYNDQGDLSLARIINPHNTNISLLADQAVNDAIRLDLQTFSEEIGMKIAEDILLIIEGQVDESLAYRVKQVADGVEVAAIYNGELFARINSFESRTGQTILAVENLLNEPLLDLSSDPEVSTLLRNGLGGINPYEESSGWDLFFSTETWNLVIEDAKDVDGILRSGVRAHFPEGTFDSIEIIAASKDVAEVIIRDVRGNRLAIIEYVRENTEDGHPVLKATVDLGTGIAEGQVRFTTFISGVLVDSIPESPAGLAGEGALTILTGGAFKAIETSLDAYRANRRFKVDDLAQEGGEFTIRTPLPTGEPGAIYKGFADLSRRQKGLLGELSNAGDSIIISKRSVSQKDIAALTAKTGDEFAVFTLGSRRMLVRGNSSGFDGIIDETWATARAAEGWRFSAHTHPIPDGVNPSTVLRSSVGDRGILELFPNNRSAILNSEGGRVLFTPTADSLSGWLPD